MEKISIIDNDFEKLNLIENENNYKILITLNKYDSKLYLLKYIYYD